MKIDIYTSTKNGNKHLSVAKGTSLESISLPNDIDSDLLTLSPFRTRLEVLKDKTHPALEQNDVIAQIEAKGYAIHGAKSTITLTVATDQ
ncbi:hypothetical protein ACVBE9_07870 [Eionea flava]